MIVGIRGKVAKANPLSVVLDVNGLYYEVNIPVTTAEKISPVGSEMFLHTLAIYREDSQALYGFATASDRDFFKLLIEKVSGIGPKIALNILSRMSVETLQSAIDSGDITLLSKCQGIGKKTAERLIVELRGSLSAINTQALENVSQSAMPSEFADAISALVALGFKLADADKAARKALAKLPENPTAEAIIKCALHS